MCGRKAGRPLQPLPRRVMDTHRKSLLELNVAVLLWAGTALFAKWIELPAFPAMTFRSFGRTPPIVTQHSEFVFGLIMATPT